MSDNSVLQIKGSPYCSDFQETKWSAGILLCTPSNDGVYRLGNNIRAKRRSIGIFKKRESTQGRLTMKLQQATCRNSNHKVDRTPNRVATIFQLRFDPG
jgi:hypothetical protein